MSTITDELAKLHSAWRVTGYPLVVVGTTSDSNRVDNSVLNGFKHVIKVEVRQVSLNLCNSDSLSRRLRMNTSDLRFCVVFWPSTISQLTSRFSTSRPELRPYSRGTSATW